jgi:arsenical pump membrane protein
VVLPAVLIGVAGIVTRPLGPLAGTMLLVLTLPVLAASLDALGWAGIAAAQIRRARRSRTTELIVAYVAWLGVSSILTLDVAAVVAVPVGIRLADPNSEASRQYHLGAAILGANVGSLLFPFSNLTNLILVSASGISFGAYLGASWLAQLGAALAVGVLVAFRTRRSGRSGPAIEPEAAGPVAEMASGSIPRLTLGAGIVALVGAITAVVIGLAGGDIAVVFGVSAAVIAGCAIAAESSDIGVPALLRSIPPSGIAVVLFAAVAVSQLAPFAARLPDLQASLPAILALPAIALVGGLLAVSLNNLPAAAFGAIWLVGASPAAVVAFLIGTNFFALATPHGSLATILSRQLGLRHGVNLGARAYLTSAWRYALVSSVVALAALLVAR